MDDRLLSEWLTTVGCDPAQLRHGARPTGGASGSTVRRIVLADGRPVVLKIAEGERGARELRFYRELADAVPVATPRLIGAVDLAGTSCLLVGDAGRPTPARSWSTDRWLRTARQLGRLHAAVPAGEPEWLRHSPARPAGDTYWRDAGYGALLDRFAEFADAVAALPWALLHGDCHADNILVGPAGRQVWVDWPEVGIGHGPEDLAPLWQRAEFDRADPPRSAMISEYAAARGIADDAALRRGCDAAELALLLSAWPDFLRNADPGSRDRLHRRLELIAEGWTAA